MISYDYDRFFEDHNDLVEVLIQEDAMLSTSQLTHELFFLMKLEYSAQPANCVASLYMPNVPDSSLADSTYYFVLKQRTVTYQDRVDPLPIDDLPLQVRIDTIYNKVYVHTHGEIEVFD
ncbi:MAG: hypothetical protein SCALA702_03770 [Melioribacteraceae bacterium]|nr:MAG: hypothetical protein SCALA702_03770 [Melioribacteraceae bacterium]